MARSTNEPPGHQTKGTPADEAKALANISVIVLCESFPPAAKSGGPTVSLSRIVRLEAAAGVGNINLITRDRDIGDASPFSQAAIDGVGPLPDSVQVYRVKPTVRAWARLRHHFRGRSALVYCNSIFSPFFTLGIISAQSLHLFPRRVLLLAPRGELAASALHVRRWKKKPLLPLLRFALGRLPVVFHASSEREAGDIKRFIGSSDLPIIVRPNPAAPPLTSATPGGRGGPVTIAFVARMVPIKNFLLLARAVQSLRMPVLVRVAGPVEDQKYWDECRRVVRAWPSEARLESMGLLDGTEVNAMLADADAFVLPTQGENFGHAIAEALAVGCPVMIPDTTPWTPVVKSGGGWIINRSDPSSLTEALTELATETETQRNGRRSTVAATYAEWWHTTQADRGSLFGEALSFYPDLHRRALGMGASHATRR